MRISIILNSEREPTVYLVKVRNVYKDKDTITEVLSTVM